MNGARARVENVGKVKLPPADFNVAFCGAVLRVMSREDATER